MCVGAQWRGQTRLQWCRGWWATRWRAARHAAAAPRRRGDRGGLRRRPKPDPATARRRRRVTAGRRRGVRVAVAVGFVLRAPRLGQPRTPGAGVTLHPRHDWRRCGSARAARAPRRGHVCLAMCARLTARALSPRRAQPSGMNDRGCCCNCSSAPVTDGVLGAAVPSTATRRRSEWLDADLMSAIAARTQSGVRHRTSARDLAQAEILQSYLRDMADRKRARAALLPSEQRFRIAAARATDLIYTGRQRRGTSGSGRSKSSSLPAGQFETSRRGRRQSTDDRARVTAHWSTASSLARPSARSPVSARAGAWGTGSTAARQCAGGRRPPGTRGDSSRSPRHRPALAENA